MQSQGEAPREGEEARAESLVRGFLRGDLSRRAFLRRAGGFSAFALASTSSASATFTSSACRWAA